VLRYSEGDAQDGYSLTGSYYRGLWNNQTDQPERAITEGLISRFGELDPTDQGVAQRINLSGQYFATLNGGQLAASAYAFSNYLSLFNNFTHFLVDPVNGDQEEQHEDRSTVGGSVSYAHPATVFGFDHELLTGFQERYDRIDVSRTPTHGAQSIPAADDPLGFSERDHIWLPSSALYTQATTHWNERIRTVFGLRADTSMAATRALIPVRRADSFSNLKVVSYSGRPTPPSFMRAPAAAITVTISVAWIKRG
jgi:hypothetical protein